MCKNTTKGKVRDRHVWAKGNKPPTPDLDYFLIESSLINI